LGHFLKQLKVPTILVTHDRTEALALAEEVVVLHEGSILQQGPVREVFSRPANLKVAGIVAVETVQPGQVVRASAGLATGLITVIVGTRTLMALAPDLPDHTKEVYVCIRAEDVILMKGDPAHSSPRNCLTGRVVALNPEGPMVRIDLDCGFPLAALLTRQASEELILSEGDQISALIKAPQIHLIPRSA
jgi:molybdate transport system ATP-binding protein